MRTSWGWAGRLVRAARMATAAAGLLYLAGCGGGGEDTAPAPQVAVARIEILSASAWLAGAGQTRELAAQAFDAGGNPVDAAITWSSSRPAAVAVDANGRLTAAVAAGSAQISAQAGGITSTPILAFVAAPAAGVIVVDDSAIVGQPVETTPGAAPSLANSYQVTLNGAAPAIGALLLGSGDKALAGRVTAVAATGTQTLVTLQPAPLSELFDAVDIDEMFDLTQAEVEIPPDVAARFTVARSGNTWTFTPKPGATVPSAAPPDARRLDLRVRRQAVTGTYARDLLPFRDCEASFADFDGLGDLPIGLEPPAFSLTLNPSYQTRVDSHNRITRLVVSAEPAVSIEVALKASAPLAGSIKCTLQLLALRLPIGGPLSLFIGGVVPVGVGLELAATVTLAETRLGAKYEGGVQASVGMDCLPLAGCAFVRSLSAPFATVTPFFDPPNVATDLRLKPEFDLYGYLDVELGNPLVGSLRFETFKARIGGKFEGEFAPPVTQVLDAAFAADYKASIKGSALLGNEISDLVTLLGLGSLSDVGLSFEQPIAASPQAISVRADRATFAAGDPVRVSVLLDPASVDFPPGLYNVDSVQLRRRIGTVTEVLATRNASPGQDRFEFDVIAPAAGNVEEWTAFVITRLLNFELASLELGAVSGSPLEPGPQPIPMGSYVVNEGVKGYMRLQSPSEQFPGLGECEFQVPEFRGQIPFDWTREANCAFSEGTIRFEFDAEHTNRGSGHLAFTSTGRFQTSTSHHTSLNGGIGAQVREYFRITAPGMSGRTGSAVGRIRVRINGQIPADFRGCSNCLAQAGAQLRIEAAGKLGLVDERLNSGPNVDPGLRRPSVDLEHVLTIPLTFDYGVPFPIFVDGGVYLFITGNHRIAVDSGVSMTYEWLDFSGLAEGAVIESYGGPVAASPTDGF